jgi:hypothetical protein
LPARPRHGLSAARGPLLSSPQRAPAWPFAPRPASPARAPARQSAWLACVVASAEPPSQPCMRPPPVCLSGLACPAPFPWLKKLPRRGAPLPPPIYSYSPLPCHVHHADHRPRPSLSRAGSTVPPLSPRLSPRCASPEPPTSSVPRQSPLLFLPEPSPCH